MGANAATAIGLLALVMALRQTAALDAERRRHTFAPEAEKARLKGEVCRRTSDLSELAGHLQKVREDENQRLARHLHDELGTLLSSTKLELLHLRHELANALPEVHARPTHLGKSIESRISLQRRITEDLRPTSLSNLGLVAALETRASEFDEGAGAGIPAYRDLHTVPLDDMTETAIFRRVNSASFSRTQRRPVGGRRDRKILRIRSTLSRAKLVVRATSSSTAGTAAPRQSRVALLARCWLVAGALLGQSMISSACPCAVDMSVFLCFGWLRRLSPAMSPLCPSRSLMGIGQYAVRLSDVSRRRCGTAPTRLHRAHHSHPVRAQAQGARHDPYCHR